MVSGIRKRPGSKQVPYLSHEFIIQNHGDIATCLCMVFIVGLMFQVTTPLASSFISPSYNLTEIVGARTPVIYGYGYKDLCLVFFYTIVAVIFHAIVQEYILDKTLPKARLSKTKEKKYHESGQLLAFYALSVAWIVAIFRDEDYLVQSISSLWVGYPHVGLRFLAKFFYIFQISYWVHVFPELYFQKVKREDMNEKITFATLNLIVCSLIYLLNFSRIGLVILFIHYLTNMLFHFSRIFYFSGKNSISNISFKLYNVVFVLASLASIILSIFVFWFGLKASSIDAINCAEGNFNTPLVRIASLAAVLALEAWMLWNFILFHCKRFRENTKTSSKKDASFSKAKKQRANKEESDFDSDKEKVSESPKAGDLKPKTS